MGAATRAKRRLKSAAKALAKVAHPLVGRLPAGGRVLTYHSVADRDDELCVRPALFRDQMACLKDSHPVVRLEHASGGEPGIAITFDDGYRDNWETAAPILEDFGLPATFFVVTGYLDGDCGTDRGPWLDWVHARELHKAGFEIGAHSHTHPRLALLSEERQTDEIQMSRARVRNEIGQAPAAFAYPFGTLLDYTLATERLVSEAGFSRACTSRYGVNTVETDPYNLWRINIDGGDTLDDFQSKVEGRLDAWRLVDSPLLARVRQAISRLADT